MSKEKNTLKGRNKHFSYLYKRNNSKIDSNSGSPIDFGSHWLPSGKPLGVSESIDTYSVEDSKLVVVPSLTYFKRKLDIVKFYVYDEDAKQRLSRHLNRVFKGNPVDFKSPFVKLINRHIGTDSVNENEVKPIVDYVLEMVLGDPKVVESSTLIDRELKEAGKVGTTSISLPWNYVTSDGRGKRLNARDYYAFTNESVDVRSFGVAVSRVRAQLMVGLIPLTRSTLEEALLKADKTTNWGLPLWLRGNELFKGELVSTFHYNIAKLLESGKIPFFKALAVLVERVQPNGTDEPKQRAAMAFAHYITLLESTFLIPFLEHIRINNIEGFEEYVSREQANIKITKMLKRAKTALEVHGFDGESYDTNIIRPLIDAAYDCLGACFPDNDQWLLHELKLQNCEADWLTPDGVYTGRNHGMSSGCGLTNIIDTICQFIMIEYCAERLSLSDLEKSNILKIMNGDDGNWQIPHLTKDLLVKFCGELGMPVNFSKALVSTTYTEFCQRYYEKSIAFTGVDGVLKDIRPILRTLNSILHFERYPGSAFSSKYYSVRAISQLEGSGKHPVFEKFVQLIIDCDTDNRLGTNYAGGPSEFIRSLSRGDKIGTFEKISNYQKSNSYEREKARELDNKLISLQVINTLEKLRRQ
jgi:hypothetical protein